MPHTFRFVNTIDPSRTVRLDLNDLNIWTLLHEGTEFTPPPIRRAEVSTMLMDGERYPSSAYGNRELQLKLMVGALSADLVATQVQKLQRELDRPQNILEWKPTSASHPVFFKTFRSPPNSIREWRGDDGRKGITVNVMAEPFAYGLRETLPAVTVNNDPAASNGMFLDVTGVKGDVETPAFLEYPSVLTDLPKTLIAIRRRGTPANMPFLLQAEAMTVSTDTTVQANDVAFSGAGSNWVRCTFATNAALVKRLEITNWPVDEGVDLRGTYRVFARVRRNDATETAMKLQLRWGATGGTLLAGDVVSSWPVFAASNIATVDLGKITLPTTADPVHVGPTGSEVPVMPFTRLELHAQRISGTANLDIDYLLFAPADDALLLHSHPDGATRVTVVDGYNEIVYEADNLNSNAVSNSESFQVAGRFSMISPGVTNRLVFMRNAGSGPDTVTDTTAVTVSYWPKYLYIRGATEPS